jgi:hypothetical protein
MLHWLTVTSRGRETGRSPGGPTKEKMWVRAGQSDLGAFTTLCKAYHLLSSSTLCR